MAASGKKGWIAEFREFIASGDMIELAVAVILAGAVGVVIKAFTDGIMLQIVAALVGKPDFSQIGFTLRHHIKNADGTYGQARLQVGNFINALITLILTGLVLFMMVKAYNRFKARKAAEDGTAEEGAPAGPSEIDLLTDIRDALRTRN